MPCADPPLSTQLSPQIRPPACQPPALPCGQPQDQLGNVSRSPHTPSVPLLVFLAQAGPG